MTISVRPVPERCRETAGFLFSHPCRNPAAGRCGRCGKPICPEHARALGEGGPVSVACARKDPSASPAPDDPYFYAGAAGFAAYASPYTEGDREAFLAEAAPEEGWEKDWDAS